MAFPVETPVLAVEVQVVPSDVSKLPDVPGATAVTALVPFPIKTAFAVKVAAPVPPFVAPTVPVSAEAGTFVSVLVDPLILLFVNVVADVAETRSPDVLGSVNTVDPETA
jgi:hypothetical protein